MQSPYPTVSDLREWPQQAFLYAAAGLFGTCLHWCVFAALYITTGQSALIASTVGAVCGALLNYQLSYRQVFHSVVRHAVALPRFFAVAGLGLLLNAAIMLLATGFLSVVSAQLLASAAVLFTGFLLNRCWSFRA